MQNLKKITADQKEILDNSTSILYTCKNDLGNFQEKEVIKYNDKFYRIVAINKKLSEFENV